MYVSQKPIILLSVQRSGTNFLRRVIGSHPEIDPLFGEIFDPNFIDHPLSFFCFYQRAVADTPALCLPDQRIVAFEKYIEYLDQKIYAKHYVLDIKYNSLRQMESYWPQRREILSQYIIDRQWPVVHLIRRDLLAAAFSRLKARSTGVWVAKEEKYCDDASICVDPGRIVGDVVGRREAILRRREDFVDAKLIEMTYEDLIEEPNAVSASAIEIIRAFLGVSDEFSRTPETKKLITQPMSQAIENYHEVLATASARKVPLVMSMET